MIRMLQSPGFRRALLVVVWLGVLSLLHRLLEEGQTALWTYFSFYSVVSFDTGSFLHTLPHCPLFPTPNSHQALR